MSDIRIFRSCWPRAGQALRVFRRQATRDLILLFLLARSFFLTLLERRIPVVRHLLLLALVNIHDESLRSAPARRV
jgi:hypothetical protein